MNTIKIDENKYSVEIYDWIDLHDDYVCGYIMRDPDADEESDLRYWMFYPAGKKPIMVGDLRRIYTFMSDLNLEPK